MQKTMIESNGDVLLPSELLAKRFVPHLLVSAPLLVAAPLGFLLLFNSLGQSRISLGAVLSGAAGWIVALVLRSPLYLLLGRERSPESMETLLASISGPVEELVRLLGLALLFKSLSTAFSFGLGWAAIEVLYSLVQGSASVLMLSRGGIPAMQLRAKFQEMGQTVEATVYWGVLERVSATALHIGFTLLLAESPLFVFVTMPLHSAINMVVLKLTRRSVIVSQVILMTFGAIVLAIGLGLFLK